MMERRTQESQRKGRGRVVGEEKSKIMRHLLEQGPEERMEGELRLGVGGLALVKWEEQFFLSHLRGS